MVIKIIKNYDCNDVGENDNGWVKRGSFFGMRVMKSSGLCFVMIWDLKIKEGRRGRENYVELLRIIFLFLYLLEEGVKSVMVGKIIEI